MHEKGVLMPRGNGKSFCEERVALLSIKPCYVAQIFSGGKRYEFRTKVFAQRVSRVIVYSTLPTGKIVGEFIVERVLSGTPQSIWAQCKDYAGLSREDFFTYFKGRKIAYAIAIKKPWLYRRSRQISSVCKRPPQSYRYV